MKLLLISDVHHFSTYDIFKGYDEAFKKLNISYDKIDINGNLYKTYTVYHGLGLNNNQIFKTLMFLVTNIKVSREDLSFINGYCYVSIGIN